jgi:hypothetical protein
MLSPDQEKLFLVLRGSSAVFKFFEGLKHEVTFADATRYWGINELDQGEALDAKLDGQRTNLVEIDKVVSESNVVLMDGRRISGEDLNLLIEVHDWLVDRFFRHLKLLRKRQRQS